MVKLVLFNLLISFKFSVASSSVCPPERNAMPGTSDGTDSSKHFKVSSAIYLQSIFSLLSTPGKIILGLSIVAFKSTLFNINSS